MTPRQSALYWREWARLRDVLRSKGKPFGQVEDYRHALTRRALGHDKSSKHFTNSDLDKVLARLRAEIDPADLDAQLALQESPDRRRAYLLERCDEVCSQMWSHGNDPRLVKPEARDGYVRGTARNVIKKELEDCTDAELGKVIGCLEARLRRLVADCAERARAAGYVPPAEKVEDGGNPF
jgi:hypothetical protein